MSVEELFDAVIALLEQHNKAVGDFGKVDTTEFILAVKASGTTTPETLKSLSHEQILDCLPVAKLANGKEIKPTVLAKSIAKIWRAGINDGEESLATTPSVVSEKKASKMTLPELVACFDPEDFTNAVGKRLSEISKCQAFIVYDSGRSVNVQATCYLLSEIKKGFEGRKVYEGKEVFKIGDLPCNYAEENPLYPGRPLRPDGTCDQTNRSWEGVPKNVRQLIFLAVKSKEIEVNSPGGIDRANNVLDLAMSSTAFTSIKARYFKAGIEFDRLEKLGQLPPLLIPLKIEGQKNPFGGGIKVQRGLTIKSESGHYIKMNDENQDQASWVAKYDPNQMYWYKK